jgi:hypothetical protein
MAERIRVPAAREPAAQLLDAALEALSHVEHEEGAVS